MRLATRYHWQIILDRVVGKIFTKVRKAAPRFELGIKDLQSSALPLGHAAKDKIFISNSNGISQTKKNVLFLSNGHGEDVIALRVMESLHSLHKDIDFEVMPLVGEGKVFRKALREGWLLKIGPSKSLPSGGFSNQSFRGLFSDLRSGLMSLLWRQWYFVWQAAKEGRTIIAVGDLFPLFFAWASGTDYFFIGTPKSDYTWTSGPHFSASDYYHRLKGSEWDPWEYILMRSHRCKMVSVRDKITARGLRNNGVLVAFSANPMMDGFSSCEHPQELNEYRRLILLCGSRFPEAYKNFKKLLIAIQKVQSSSPIAIFAALSSNLKVEKIEFILDDFGFKPITKSINGLDISACWTKNGMLLIIAIDQFACCARWGEVGVANAGTATEQLVGLGIPCVCLPGKGPQFKLSFAKRQSRLLGGAVAISTDSKDLAKRVEFLLNSEKDRKSIGLKGSKRMAQAGGSQSLGSLISSKLF